MHPSTPSGVRLGRQRFPQLLDLESTLGSTLHFHQQNKRKAPFRSRIREGSTGELRPCPVRSQDVLCILISSPAQCGSQKWGAPAPRAARAVCKHLEGPPEPGLCVCVPRPRVGCMFLSLQVAPRQGPRLRGAAHGLWLRPRPSWSSGSGPRAGPGKAPSPTCCCPSSSWPWPWPCSW